MQAWDYLTVSARWGGEGNHLRPAAINGKNIAEWGAGIPLAEYICELGEQGWELISEWYDPNTAAGARWQYHWLWTDEMWKKLTVGDCTYEGMQGYFEYLSQMGGDRWELAAAAPQTFTIATDGPTRRDRDGPWLLIFKRPADDSSVTLRFKRPRPGGSW